MQYVRMGFYLKYMIYIALILFCVYVIIIMQRMSGTIEQCTNEDVDDQFPERIILRDSSIIQSYLDAPSRYP